jgi:ATP phosphoribosyltransferase regulatory subunit
LQKLSERLSSQAKHDAIIAKALSDLTYLVSYLEDHWDANVSVDVTGLGYHYHTGIVFNVYVADESLPLIRGGRFSNHFHHEADNTDAVRSGVGFSCELNRWQNHIQVHEQPFTVVPYSHVQTILHVPNHPDAPALKQAIDSLRQEGHRVMIALDETDEPEQTTHRLQVANGVWYLEHLAEN